MCAVKNDYIPKDKCKGQGVLESERACMLR